jgi:ABC-type multidrug transport system ATPase subunit
MLTVRETLQYSADVRLPALSKAERQDRVEQVIGELGLKVVPILAMNLHGIITGCS